MNKYQMAWIVTWITIFLSVTIFISAIVGRLIPYLTFLGIFFSLLLIVVFACWILKVYEDLGERTVTS